MKQDTTARGTPPTTVCTSGPSPPARDSSALPITL